MLDFSPWFVIAISTMAGALAALVVVIVKARNPRVRLILGILLVGMIALLAWTLLPVENRVTRISSGGIDSQ